MWDCIIWGAVSDGVTTRMALFGGPFFVDFSINIFLFGDGILDR